MPVAASCPSCAAPLSETSVVALAPICSHCGVVITVMGGTLGLTGVYGVSDRTITRRRVEADLAVFREYQQKYRGMKEASLQQLNWGVERYAKLPQPPELLALQDVSGVGASFAGLYYSYLLPVLTMGFGMYFSYGGPTLGEWIANLIPVINWISLLILLLPIPPVYKHASTFFSSLILLAILGAILVPICSHIANMMVNGPKPQENARRQKAYDKAVATALKAAEPLKAAQDHRLRTQIRELESLAKTIGEKEAEVTRLLPT